MKRMAEWLITEGTRVAQKAAGAVLSGGRGQEAAARAVGVAQRGLTALGAAQQQALHAVGLAARPDYDDVRKRLARIKRKVRDLEKRVSGGGAPGGAGGADNR